MPPVKESMFGEGNSITKLNECISKAVDHSLPSPTEKSFSKKFHPCSLNENSTNVYIQTPKSSSESFPGFNSNIKTMCNCCNLQAGKTFPIAIIGLGCRMPGGVLSPEDFWKIVSTGQNVISEIPKDRWNIDAYYNVDSSKPNTMVTKKAGFVDNIDMFDHSFFKISPREAAMIDPQQRLLLEVTHEAFEDAGIIPQKLQDKCGVFVGIGMIDYSIMLVHEKENVNQYLHTGVAHSVAANRISYVFDLKGPSLAVDTACAASMTSMHVACNSLWNEDCEVGVVAGCNILALPEITCGFSAMGVLSPDGECRPFDEDAKGYVRSEGWGVCIIKPLEKAIRDQDHIYCIIKGTGIGDNGYSSSLTMPSKDDQEHLMKKVYTKFNIPLKSISYVEAHGTGTPVGDPIEANAIGNVFGPHHKEPLRIGSVKSNFGHMELAAGMASMIKACLMLEKRMLVPSINFKKPNSKIDTDNLNITIQTKLEPFQSKFPIRIGVNCFGFGGALAHLILEENTYFKQENCEQKCNWKFGSNDKGKNILIPLSAKSNNALIDLCTKWTLFRNNNDALSVVGWQAMRRSHFSNRLAIIANSGDKFIENLNSFTQGINSEDIVTNSGSSSQPKICFVFPGQGQQWANMGRNLYENEDIFRTVVNTCDAIFETFSGWSLIKDYHIFCTKNGNSIEQPEKAIDKIEVSMPAITIFQLALYELWKHWGLKPTVIIGHSLGEIAAAYACGGLTLKEAISVVYIRSKEQAKLANTGSMAAVRMTREEGNKLCSQYENLYVACENSPSGITIAGDTNIITQLSEEFPEKIKKLRVQCAFHTPHMDPIKDSFLKAMNNVVKSKPMISDISFYSTVTGELYSNNFDGLYWWNNIRMPVKFTTAVQTILKNHHIDIFLEIGSAATLLSCIGQTAQGQKLNLVTSCQRQRDDYLNVLNALAKLYVNGAYISWNNYTKFTSSWAPLPTYPWQHQSHWNESEVFRLRRLGLEDKSFKGQNGKISLKSFPYLADHVIQNRVVFPAAGYIEYMVENLFKDSDYPCLEDIHFLKVLPLNNDDKDEIIQLTAKTDSSQIFLLCNNNLYSQAKISTALTTRQENINVKDLLMQCPKEISAHEFYKYFSTLDLNYGENFQMIEKVFLGDWKAVGYLKPCTDRYQRLNVAILDAAFQIAEFAVGYGTTTYLPVNLSYLNMYTESIPLNEPLIIYANITDCDTMNIIGDIILTDMNGSIILKVLDFKAQNISGTKTSIDLKDCLYETCWQPVTSCLPSTNIAESIFNEEFLKINFAEDYKGVQSAELVLTELQKISAAYARHALDSVPEEKYHPRNDKYVQRLKVIVSEYESKYSFESLDGRLKLIEEQCPEFALEISMVKRLGSILSDTLQDPSVALQILFAADCLAQYFINSLSTRIYYKGGSEIIRQAVEHAAKHKKIIRILEIGGRMGGLAVYILNSLKDLIAQDRIQYVFTDLNVTFFLHAQQTLSEYPSVKYQQLDFEKNVFAQDFSPGSFDIVVCMDTIHSAIDINIGIKNMADLLCEDGWLMLYEATNASPMCEIIFGSLELCWIFNDERKNICWLPKEGWAQSLECNGFENVVSVTTPNEFFHSITIGKKSSTDFKQISKDQFLIASTTLNGISHSLAKYLNCKAIVNPDDANSISNFLQVENEQCSIIYLWSDDDADLHKLLSFYKIICKYSNSLNKVWIITENGNMECKKLSHSLAIGFTRVASNELKHLPIISIDLPHLSNIEAKVKYLINAINYQSPDREIAIRNDTLLVPRIYKSPKLLNNNICKGKWRLEINTNVNKLCLDDVNFYQLPLETLGDNSVKIKVKASALNFKDVMMAMGMLEGLNLGQTLGLECSGIVTEIGEKVKNVNVGDAVIALGENCFAEEVICDSYFVAKKPEDLSFTDAAGFSMVYITAYHALIERAAIQKNETVLIHSACGGVGLAAIQIAKMVGAKIICTVGTQEKRDFLQNILKIDYVTNSHSLSFHDDVLKFTNGKGVDVVLNSLSGQFLIKSMELLSPGGRFCEIGKRDILENTDLKILRCFLENKSLLSVQIDLLMKANPSKINYLLNKVIDLYSNHQISPLPTEVKAICDWLPTFRWMSSGQHIGKVVLNIPNNFYPEKLKPTLQLFNSNALYLITGGFGGIGMSIVRWIAKKGAKHICLLSRSGCKSEASRSVINYVKKHNASLYSFTVDVSNQKELENALTTVKTNCRQPLKGIFHLACVIDDASIPNLTKEQLDKCLNAKYKGAYNLHELTKEDNLDFFIMMSSVNSAFGNPEQANYVAANSYLDALAVYRQSNNLPGLSLQLGAVRGAGFIDDKPDVAKITQSKGLLTLHINECLEAIETFISKSDIPPVVCLAYMDWIRTSHFVYPTFMKFRHLLQEDANKTGCVDITSEDLCTKVKEKISELLFIPADQIESNKPMIDYGVDSLMAVELVNWLNKEFKVHVSQLDILGGMTTDILLSKALEGEVVLPLKQ